MTFSDFYNTWFNLILDKTQFIPEYSCDNDAVIARIKIILIVSLLAYHLIIVFIYMAYRPSETLLISIPVVMIGFLVLSNYLLKKINTDSECTYGKISVSKQRIYPTDYTVDDFKSDMDKIGDAASAEQLLLAKNVMSLCLKEKAKDPNDRKITKEPVVIECIRMKKKLFLEKQIYLEIDRLDQLK
ncbi:hypothetical protein [Snodgrassella alvi]|jgi:hypothetical protein|uniref:Uncharacterized protein n=1 Tax=Snodgrassella alvi TaxID=1196083 RepID=A0A855G1A4_9NEIS|nr:hypothetical protein [Snodgrassella alvi]PIT60463.1 hypothetical protein BHC57_03970 [Snodgrassella alvi]